VDVMTCINTLQRHWWNRHIRIGAYAIAFRCYWILFMSCNV